AGRPKPRPSLAAVARDCRGACARYGTSRTETARHHGPAIWPGICQGTGAREGAPGSHPQCAVGLTALFFSPALVWVWALIWALIWGRPLVGSAASWATTACPRFLRVLATRRRAVPHT